MMRRLVAVLLAAALLAGVIAVDDGERFYERLLIRPLPDHTVLLHFEFNMTMDRALHPDNEFYRLFPKPIAQVVIKHQVDEFDLTLSQGRWRYSGWGLPVIPAPSGGQLIAYIRKNGASNSLNRWKGLQQSLSGMVCASLEQIGHTDGDVPESVIAPDSGLGYINSTSHTTYFGVLPREAVCTENLTPWAKLLPCRTRAGLGVLLSPLDLHDASYHAMGINVHSRPAANGRTTVAKFWLSVVLDPLYLTKNRHWTPNSLLKNVQEWPLKCSPISSACEILFDTRYTVREGDVVQGLKASKPIRTEGELIVFNPNEFELEYDPGEEYHVSAFQTVPLLVQRHATGKGLHVGGIVNTIVNTDSVPHRIAMFDSFPWFFRLYFHTMKVRINGTVLSPDFIRFRPSRQSERPAVIKMQLELPAHSTCVFSIQFEKAFLPIKDFPPDVSRGFDLGPAIVKMVESGRLFYTESLVILFPAPDMSMPFNVIAFTSTFLAFFFGMMFNVLYRHPKELANRKKGGLLLQLIQTCIAAVKRFISRFKNGNKPKVD